MMNRKSLAGAGSAVLLVEVVCLSVAGASRATTAGQGDATARQATFEVRHELTVRVPEGAQRLRVWFVLPQEDPMPGDGTTAAQRVRDLQIDAPYPHRVERDSEGSQVLYLEATNPPEKEVKIVETFIVTRHEVRMRVDPSQATPLTEADRATFAPYLAANTHVVIDEEIRQLAREIVGQETNPVLAARKLYDWVLHNVDYWVKDPKHKKASPVGSTTYCLTFRTGNCTDFEALWTSLARAAGIPSRIVYGSFFKPDLDGADADQSYHCWATFYALGLGWVPHDVAVADMYAGEMVATPDNATLMRRTTADGMFGADPAKVEYYFGNLDERRMVWSVGRDLMLSPKQEGGPVNAMAKAYVEIDGTVHPEGTGWVRKLTYRERKAH
ncbi:MAG TPA: transglutaminase domain-containing protein [Candidatus Tectomicrobia bacterium]|nr:transglutaminase domain-containing protein [Candidatus Tectomicrobia bacterium]